MTPGKFSSVAQSCPTLCDPMNRSTLRFPVHHQLPCPTPILVKLMSIESLMPSKHITFCHLLLLPPSIFPSIRVFSSESVLHIRWSKYWIFSFNISPSSVHPGLISFRLDWLDLLTVQGTTSSKSYLWIIFKIKLNKNDSVYTQIFIWILKVGIQCFKFNFDDH